MKERNKQRKKEKERNRKKEEYGDATKRGSHDLA